jgi:hypothetical protein
MFLAAQEASAVSACSFARTGGQDVDFILNFASKTVGSRIALNPHLVFIN